MKHSHFTSPLRWIWHNVELTSLALLVMIIGGAWSFAELVDEVFNGNTRSLDTSLLLLLRDPINPDLPRGPWWLQEMGRDLTALGGIAVLTLAIIGTTGYFLLKRRFGTALFLLVSTGGGMLLSSFAKGYFDRARPELVSHGSLVVTPSFPSGHTLMAAVVYFTLGVIVARSLPGFRLKAYVLSLAAALAMLVGISRVYLGVHWPTDVLAGWIIGAVWAALCLLVARFLARRGRLEHSARADLPGPMD
ncbi:phosphatase PAP2 family protein [Tropicimonas aquimaris]|uniref:Phosphatase PAP2 family protein n=1 Tax=Tropicimonas aquimaris TaxID=914152 RepID=A0ABW3IJY8_9RHOB